MKRKQEEMRERKNQRGITLIALVVTIVVLLILAGVSINLVVGNNGIITKAKNAKEQTIIAGEKEAVEVAYMACKTADYDSIVTAEQLQSELIRNGKDVTVTSSGTNLITEYNDTKHKYYISQDGSANTIDPIEEGRTYDENTTVTIDGEQILIPGGFTVSGLEDEVSIEKGLVIYDLEGEEIINWEEDNDGNGYLDVQEDYNQFVWIPVEKAFVTAEELAQIINNDTTGTITTETQALQSLTDSGIYPMAVKINNTDYRGVLYNFYEDAETASLIIENYEFSSTDDYLTATYYREPAYLTGATADASTIANTIGLTQASLQTEYNNIINSVSSTGGFWVARFELSYNSNTEKGETQRNKTVTSAGSTETYMWYGLYDTCKKMYETSNAQTSMIYGSQWDQIMIWMKDVKNIEDESSLYIYDSYYMGNYSGTAENTGSSDDYEVKNVFDLAGNYDDWTVQSSSKSWRISRGFSYPATECSSDVYSASVRSDFHGTGGNYDHNSARASLYVPQ